MKDCDGNELAVGDVVEPFDGWTEGVVVRMVEDMVCIRRGSVEMGVTAWYAPSELRLVRRKEMTNAKR